LIHADKAKSEIKFSLQIAKKMHMKFCDGRLPAVKVGSFWLLFNIHFAQSCMFYFLCGFVN